MCTCKGGVTHQNVLKWDIFKRWGQYMQSRLWGFNMEKLRGSDSSDFTGLENLKFNKSFLSLSLKVIPNPIFQL